MTDQRDPIQLLSLLAAMPAAQVLLLASAAIVWLVGGNLVIAACCRRIGKPWWHGFKPGSLVLQHFGRREWAWLVALAAVSLGLIISAATVGAPSGA